MSLIEDESNDSSEVKEPEWIDETPKLERKLGRPKKEKVEAIEAKNKVLDMLSAIQGSINALSDRLQKVEKDTEQFKTSEPPKEKEYIPAVQGKEGAIIEAVKKILGQGNATDCQFSVSTIPNAKDRNFRLIIVPPTHLKEFEGAKNAKVLSYNEGVSGAEEYARLVLRFCTKLANSRAVSFFSK